MVDFYQVQKEYRQKYTEYVYRLLKAREELRKCSSELDGLEGNGVLEGYECGYEQGHIDAMMIHMSFLADRYKR